eukprot:COSAG03_NODE_380_length_8364_cov_20.212099_14_plen_67_part_01
MRKTNKTAINAAAFVGGVDLPFIQDGCANATSFIDWQALGFDQVSLSLSLSLFSHSSINGSQRVINW